MPNSNKRGKIDPQYLSYFRASFWNFSQSVPPENIFNMDETSWAPTALKQKTVGRKGKQTPARHFTGTDPKDHITMIGTISAAGTALPLILIAKGTTERCEEKFKQELANHAARNRILFTHSINGWMTADVAKHYLSFLRDWATSTGVTGDIVLLWDVFQAHKAKGVVEHAEALGIRLLLIPANGTNYYQPLDMAIYGELKRSAMARLADKHINACLEAAQTGFKIFETIDCILEAWCGITQDHVLRAWRLLLKKCDPSTN
jgi:hypothetical protein